jgi:PAS domain S-box-containing protein
MPGAMAQAFHRDKSAIPLLYDSKHTRITAPARYPMPDPSARDPHAFLGPDTGVASLIRSFDWASTPIGALAQWPAALKHATALILRSPVPMTLLWGGKGVLIYNDAYGEFAGQRHPALLGAEVLLGWPEVAEFNANVLAHVLAGKTLSYTDLQLVLIRHGEAEDVWLTLDYSPVTDEDGVAVGGLAVVKETTNNVLAEQRLRIAQEVGKVGSFEWYPKTGRVEASDQYRLIWGIGPDVAVTDALLVSLVHPDDRHLLGRPHLDSDNPLGYAEYRRVDPLSGTHHWIARRGEMVLSGTSGERRYIGIALDITERKLAEAAMVRSETRWRDLFERMQEGFFVASAIRDAHGAMTDFRFVEANPAFAQQSGLDASEALGKTMRELVQDVQDDLIQRYAEVLETGESAQFELQTPSMQRWFEVRAHRIDEDHFAVLFMDISQRRKGDEAIRESEQRFRLLAQALPNQIWTANEEGELDWFNEQVYAYSGAAPGTLDGEGWANLVHVDDVDHVSRAWSEALVTGDLYEAEFRLRRHDGAYRWFVVRAVLVRTRSGAFNGWVGSNTDIEDQKAAEVAAASAASTLERAVVARTAELLEAQEELRQSQKMETLGNLTGGIAHDFNNLLQVISGNLQLLGSDVVDNPRAARRVENAMTGVSRGAKLASQLLAFGRRQPLAPKAINPARLLRNMDDLFRRCLGGAIELETIIAGGLWNTLIDPGNLENALLNLAINARDAMESHGRLTIEAGNAYLDDSYVRAFPGTVAGQYVLIAVTDTGCGMPTSLLEKVFEPFFTTKPDGRGTGLGLSMVYGFVKQSGGHIKLYSEVGQGTTVKLYLPRSKQAEELSGEIEDVAASGGNETILVAEDDDAVRDSVVALLAQLGYTVLQAHDAAAALAVIESGAAIDLLFTDVIMPGNLRSPELAAKARQLLPDIAVLYTSGYTENAIVHGGRLDEGLELLSKPYSGDVLARKLRQVLQRQQERNERAAQAATDASVVVPTPKPLQILLCEDDPQVRMTVVDALQSQGFRVIEAATATEALRLFEGADIDLLLTDIVLPDRSGLELAQLLRTARGDRPLPVLYATGRFDEVLPQDRFSAVVTKPYGFGEILQAIQKLTSANP